MAEGESSSRPRPGSVVELLRERFESPQQRGRVFERLLAAALRAHPGQYGPLRFKRVWRWSDWPDREREGYGADVGIDLVAEQTDGWGGGLCAIQAKLHDPSASLGKAAVDSFLSASSAGCFTSRLLVVTAKLGYHAALMVEKAQPRCEVLNVEQLDKWPVDWAAFLERPEELRFEAQRYAPKCYQKAAVEAVVSGLDSRDCGKLILPCGTGKSVVALWIAERIASAGRGGGDGAGSDVGADAGGVGSGASCSGAGAGGKVLYLVPSIALMGQTMREWAAQRDPRITHRYIGVCSDTRAGRNDEDADLTELAMPVTTDSQRVAEALSATASANDHAADTGTAGIDTAGSDAAGADAGDSATMGAAIRGAGTVSSDIAAIEAASSDIASSDAVGSDAAGADAGDSAMTGAAIRGAGTVSSDIAAIEAASSDIASSDAVGSDAAGADISLPDSAAADSADTVAEGAMTVVFCTYQSLEVIEQAQRAVPGGAVSASFDLVICDEAHRTTGVHETDAGSHFTLIHDRRRILADKRLYMTATPRIYTDRVRAQAREHSRDFDVFSMDDETVFGPELYRMSFGEAVEGKHLSDYEVLVIAVSELHVSSLLGNEVLNLHDDEAAAPRGGGGAQRTQQPQQAQRITTEEAVKFVGCWDALANPSTRSPHGRVTGAVDAKVPSVRRAIAFTNTIKSSLLVEQHWNRIVDTVAAEALKAAAARDRAARLTGHSLSPAAEGQSLSTPSPSASGLSGWTSCTADSRIAADEVRPEVPQGELDSRQGTRTSTSASPGSEPPAGAAETAQAAQTARAEQAGKREERTDTTKPCDDTSSRASADGALPAPGTDPGRKCDDISSRAGAPGEANEIEMVATSGRDDTSSRAGSPGIVEASELLRFDVRHTDGSRNALQRSRILGWLSSGDPDGGCRIVTNAKCLTEGVDVPALDAVLFLAPKRSQVDVVQAVGRVMRRAPGKECGFVVLPVVVPAGMSLDDDKVLSGSDFKVVWSVLKALRSHDERLDVAINTADLNGKPPFRIIHTGPLDDGDDTEEDDDSSAVTAASVQGRLPLHDAIASKVVEQCGDRQYWHRWGAEVARITGTIAQRARTALRTDPLLESAFANFEADMAATIGRELPRSELVSMLAQHVVTVPVFDALFSGSGFADRNPISKALNELLDEFKAAEVMLRDETRGLERFYASVAARLSGAADSDTRIKVMLEVYEQFFKAAMPDETKRLGIVYTPVELVDFVLRSVDAAARAEFGRGLSDAGVNILDPFTGTGTFINRLLIQRGSDGEFLIRDSDLARKFHGAPSGFAASAAAPEIHANEVVLLAYYLAALKIEEGFRERTGGYEPFEGIVLTDTFHLSSDGTLPGTGAIADNSERVKAQNELPIQVIVANPPWSAGKKSAEDNNPNISYPHIEQRVRETYGSRHKQVTGRGAGKSAGNLYVEAIRWASDRINDPDGKKDRPGILAFVHPNSLGNAPSLAGMRATLRDEFTSIYVVNLLGDAMKSGDERRREGDNVFGVGSRNGVQITVLVRNPAKGLDEPAALHYAEVPEYSTLKQKLDWLAALGDVTGEGFEIIEPNDAHDWINITDGSFDKLMPVCELGKKERTGRSVASEHALGIATNCDVYVYSFSREELRARMSRLIDAYNEALEFVEAGCTVEECTGNDELDRIKWTDTLKQSLRRRQEIVFDESRIREVLYRPFTKLWLYEDDRILSSAKTISAMFPKPQPDVDNTHTHTHTFSSAAHPTGLGSQLSPPSGFPISTRSTEDAERSPGGGDLDQLDSAAPVRSAGDRQAGGPLRHGPSDAMPSGGDEMNAQGGGVHQHSVNHQHLHSAGHGTSRGSQGSRDQRSLPDHSPVEAILMASPSNRTVFAALAAEILPDLHTVDPACRAMTRRRP